MFRAVVLLTACLLGLMTFQSVAENGIVLPQYDFQAIKKEAWAFLEIWVINWTFAAGLAIGIIAGELARIFWRFSKVAMEFLSVVGGRAFQYGAIACVAGIAIYYL